MKRLLTRRSRRGISCEEECADDEHSVSLPVGVAALCVFFALFGLILWNDTDLPKPFVSQNTFMFNPNKTLEFLERLVAIGPRVTGSRENEVVAVELLVAEIDRIIAGRTAGLRIERRVESVSGAFRVTSKPDSSIRVYRNVTNVAVKIWSHFDTGDSILVNSHFDSRPGSPGGSDDGVMVAMMMEMLRIFSRWDPPKQDLVFLFNGAEETGLMASHGFIANDPWAKDVRIFVNLEATGVGGKEMLFQTGPDRPNLMAYYGQVPRPHAQAAGEEIFQSNIIPSDTDFRIFRDFGNYIGFDLAYSREGYRYHTKYDDIRIDPGVLQHTGDNLRALLRAMVYDYAFQKRTYDAAGTLVYYDYMGVLLIHYNSTLAIVFNCLTILISCGTFGFTLVKFDIWKNRQDLKYVSLTVVGLIVTYLVSISFVLLLGTGLDWTNFTMRWFRSSWLLLGLYCAPTVLLNGVGVFLLNKFNRKEGFSLGMQTQLLLQGNNLFWTLLLLVGTAMGIRSVYVFLYQILFCSLAFLLIQILKLQGTPTTWKWIYGLMMILPTTFCFQIAFEIVFLFLPICGRMGDSSNPELLVGTICFFLTLLATCYYIPLLATVKYFKYILAAFLAVFLLFFVLAHTPVTFPYDVSGEPRPQRYTIEHMYSKGSKESKFVFANLDRNSPGAVSDFVPEIEAAHRDPNNDVWITAGEPPVNYPEVDLKILNKTVKGNSVTLDLHILGPDRMYIGLYPRDGVRVTGTDLLDSLEESDEYEIKFVAGDAGGLRFSLELERTDGQTSGSLLEVQVKGQYLHDFAVTEEFREFLARFPDWAYVDPSVSQIQSWNLYT